MKKIKFSKSLDLNKSVITKLSDNQSSSILGGITGSACPPATGKTCPGSDRLCTNVPCATAGCPTKNCF